MSHFLSVLFAPSFPNVILEFQHFPTGRNHVDFSETEDLTGLFEITDPLSEGVATYPLFLLVSTLCALLGWFSEAQKIYI